jgi:hypothetical protein
MFEDLYKGIVMESINVVLNADAPDEAFRSVSIAN